jgi:hypothetical protein
MDSWQKRFSDRNAFEIYVLLTLGLIAAFGLFEPIRKELITIYDEGSYYIAASDIRQNGIFSKYGWAEIHSYFYPTLLAYGIPAWLEVPEEKGRLAVFILNAAAYFITAFLIAWTMRPVLGKTRTLAMLAMLCLNPFTLIYLGYSLTDSISTTLTLALVIAVTLTFQAGKLLTVKQAALTGFLLGAAAMTRPANIYLFCLAVPALFLHLYQGIRAGRVGRTGLVCLIAIFAVLVMCVPQSVNRYRNFGKLSPLIIQSGVNQLTLARQNTKFVTFVHPAFDPAVFYRNPFFETPVDGRSSSKWSELKARGLSILVKMFGLIDQDYIRPYTYSLTPPDRWIGTVLSLCLFLIGALGLSIESWAAWKALWRSRFISLEADHAFALCSVLTIGGCFSLYSQTMVESRFGIPIVAIVLLFVPSGFRVWCSLSGGLRGAAIVFLVAAIGGGCWLSHWIQSLAEPIARAWQS